MKGKIFTPDEITRMLPLVRRIVMDLKACATLVARHERAVEELEESARRASSHPSEDELAEHREKIGYLRDKAADCRRELEELGGQVEDERRGIARFYGERDSRIVYYTWRLGEGEVSFWYPIEKSYDDRMPLDGEEKVAKASNS